ncbi:MAG: toprim domain-containing protein [Candidatus Caldarchaeum sp.]|nr:toprim domain-containing protein [Candidatus Caldarchaeum sp.]
MKKTSVDEKFYQEIRKIFDNLVDDSSEDVVVLVEGAKDEKALRMIGVRGKILHASTAEKELMNMPKPSKIILLFDFDEEGEKALKRMAQSLTAKGYRVDQIYHKKLRVLKRVGVTTVEAMKKFAQR